MLDRAFVCAQCTARVTRPVLKTKAPFSLTSRRLSSNATPYRPTRVAIVGSGPAGFYAAARLLRKQQDVVVDMYEKLPVPFGLARYGVAPDHPEVKNCEETFTEVATSPRFNFVGNIDLGNDLPLTALKPHYDAILFAYGASKDKELGIPGRKPSEVYIQLVRLSGDAVIVGQGNVALDVARILLTDVDALRTTDIADYALEALSKSRIKRVRVVGRRGPLQAAFTIKEIRELLQLPSVAFDPISKDIFPPDDVVNALPRAQKRLMQLLGKGSTNDPQKSTKSWSLDFLLSPDSLHWSPIHPYHLSHAKFSRNELDSADPYNPSSKVTPKYLSSGKPAMVNLPASIFFRSVGYKSLPLPGLEDIGIRFDDQRGVIPNDGFGRVRSPSSAGDQQKLPDGSVIAHLPGLYCAGWVKRGPTGVIASTMTDAFTTADSIIQDLASHSGSGSLLHDPDHSSGLGWDGVKAEAECRGLRSTSWKDWQRIDAAERKRGQQKGKIRDKMGRVEEMLQVLD
ncbi:hypothetical protein N7526_004498 [Penicillium atrosanguineum]|nr:hypothetical protein N7526_004498 [Penicillium atrosanguineum]